MELIDSRTGECRGNILILDNPVESPTATPVTIHVDQENWEMLETIADAQKELVNAFRDTYDQPRLESLLDALNSTSYALRVQDFRNTLLVMADGLRPDAN